MFVQVISGPVTDAEALRRQLDRWVSEQQPSATGYLGTTAGVTADGTCMCIARFESAEAASANSERPEQGQWWVDTEKCFAEPPTFEDATDVDEWLGGGSDDAGFVQLMRYSVSDRARLRELDRAMGELAREVRPDIIGGIRAWVAPDTCLEVVYFTSEAEARAGERKEHAELSELAAELDELSSGVRYFDLADPWLYRG